MKDLEKDFDLNKYFDKLMNENLQINKNLLDLVLNEVKNLGSLDLESLIYKTIETKITSSDFKSVWNYIQKYFKSKGFDPKYADENYFPSAYYIFKYNNDYFKWIFTIGQGSHNDIYFISNNSEDFHVLSYDKDFNFKNY